MIEEWDADSDDDDDWQRGGQENSLPLFLMSVSPSRNVNPGTFLNREIISFVIICGCLWAFVIIHDYSQNDFMDTMPKPSLRDEWVPCPLPPDLKRPLPQAPILRVIFCNNWAK